MNNKNKDIINGILVVLILISVVVLVGVSYAAWTMNAKQTNTNVVSTGCFETSSDLGTSSESDGINLVDAIPMSDSDGMSLTGFTFTITNVCKTYATYQVNLETLSTSTLDISYLTAVLNNNTPKKLSNYQSVNKYLNEASSSNKLISGGLAQNESVTYTLRLWIGDDIDYTPAISNKTYSGKIVVKSLELVDELATNKIQNLVAGASSSSTDVITVESEEVTCTNTLAYDGTADNNLRYVGANPCNYACFNGECPHEGTRYYVKDVSTGQDAGWGYYDSLDSCNLAIGGDTNYECTPITMTVGGWRVIGIMNNVDDGTGKKEQRVKLIRNDSLGKYSWDISPKTVNNGYGINQWGATDTYEGADLMRELNIDYLNYNLTSNPMWYGKQNGYSDSNYNSGYGQNTEFDKSKALSASAQSLIGDAVWYTGAYNDTNIGSSAVTTPASYQNEKSDNPNATNNGKYCSSGTYCNDTVIRTTSWTGKVALMNVSDYGYAVGGLSRSTCLTTNLISYSSNSCNTNDWLLYGTWQWSLSPDAIASGAYNVGSVSNDGWVNDGFASINYMVRPAVYLLSSVKITGGNGSESNPFKFAY